MTSIESDLIETQENAIGKVLKSNAELFVWTDADMSNIHPSIMWHKLALLREAHPVAQKKRRLGAEKGCAVDAEVKKHSNGQVNNLAL